MKMTDDERRLGNAIKQMKIAEAKIQSGKLPPREAIETLEEWKQLSGQTFEILEKEEKALHQWIERYGKRKLELCGHFDDGERWQALFRHQVERIERMKARPLKLIERLDQIQKMPRRNLKECEEVKRKLNNSFGELDRRIARHRNTLEHIGQLQTKIREAEQILEQQVHTIPVSLAKIG
jgi:exonuclease VII small subunit